MIGELAALKKLTQLIVDNPMEVEYNILIKSTLDALPYPIFIVDSVHNIKFINNYLSLYFNIDINKYINKRYTDTIFKNNDFNNSSLSYKNTIRTKELLSTTSMKKFPIFNTNNKIIGYVCIINIKQDLNTASEFKQSVLYANSILSTTTFNSESIAVQCDLKNNLNITKIFSSTNTQQVFSWLEGKSYVDDITYVLDRTTIESYVKTLKNNSNKNMIWNSRIYNKDNNILPVQQYMSLQNGYLLVHVASNDNSNIETDLS